MNVFLFDPPLRHKRLLPFTYTRPIAAIRIGILTIKEKWDRFLNTDCSYLPAAYLQQKYPYRKGPVNIGISGHLCPDKDLVEAIKSLQPGETLMQNSEILAFCSADGKQPDRPVMQLEYTRPMLTMDHVWDIFKKNGEALKADFDLLTAGRSSATVSSTVTVIGDKKLLFLEPGAKAEACIINTSTGPVYIGEGAEIMEGAVIRGPFSLGAHSTLKLSAKIYGPTTIGPHCKVGGEVSNSVIFGCSNKAHDGFIGNSVIGEWCNLGADTNCSNLKNNYGTVKLFSYELEKPVDTGLQFCGLMMGDHSKSGINTMFNTGTVVGVGANIFGGGFPPTHLPSFSWGGAQGFETYRLEKMFETALKVFERREMRFDQQEQNILSHIFKVTGTYRSWGP